MLRWFHKKGSFNVHSFDEDYLSIPECQGSWENLFQEILGSTLGRGNIPYSCTEHLGTVNR